MVPRMKRSATPSSTLPRSISVALGAACVVAVTVAAAAPAPAGDAPAKAAAAKPSPKPPANAPYRNAKLPIDKRVADLLGRMTLVEKVAQVQSVNWEHTHVYDPQTHKFSDAEARKLI